MIEVVNEIGQSGVKRIIRLRPVVGHIRLEFLVGDHVKRAVPIFSLEG